MLDNYYSIAERYILVYQFLLFLKILGIFIFDSKVYSIDINIATLGV